MANLKAGATIQGHSILHAGNFDPTAHPAMRGAQGPQGPQGAGGDAGAKGPQGSAGDKGQKGAQAENVIGE